QLVYGMPWGSEKQPEAKLIANVKEEERTGDNRLNLALKDLAGWYRGQKKTREAEASYKRALEFQLKRIGEHHDTALSYNGLGVFYTEIGKYAEAEPHFKKALELWDKKWYMPLKTEDNAATYHNYAVMLEKSGRAADGKAMEDRALAIMRERQEAIDNLGKK